MWYVNDNASAKLALLGHQESAKTVQVSDLIESIIVEKMSRSAIAGKDVSKIPLLPIVCS